MTRNDESSAARTHPQDNGADDTALLAQSLARGAAGTALLHIERAHTQIGTWQTARAWVNTATREEIIASHHTGLFYGAPAITFVLRTAQADGIPRYRSSINTLHGHLTRTTELRLQAANARIERGETTTFAEYDLFYGLTGIGALLLRHSPEVPQLQHILTYLVQLTRPLPDGRPGWWVAHAPDPLLPTPGGHLNLGMAHGAAGILAFLSTAARRGRTVPGQLDAIADLGEWFDRWQQDGPAGPWWPQWISGSELTTAGRSAQTGPPRPSWCYGTPGIGRAQQLAAIALADAARQRRAEHALAASLTDPDQLALITDPGLCHGIAGVYQTAWRAARDALTPTISQQLPAVINLLHQHTPPADPAGLLDGSAGLALAQHTAAHPDTPPLSGWDACLLID
ncbi:lanthionine synthetase C family protein [Actinomadura fulvescens]|uniref:Lanthionine synthetase C family protein n=1 Tax=Actinomadura fulvescens TaxID=46160 RepID=A0ABP6CUT8_9ACTN